MCVLVVIHEIFADFKAKYLLNHTRKQALVAYNFAMLNLPKVKFFIC
jgi:hypothetical protein